MKFYSKILWQMSICHNHPILPGVWTSPQYTGLYTPGLEDLLKLLQ